MNDLMTKSFTSYVELKKEAMTDLEACNPDPNLEMSATSSRDRNLMTMYLEEAETIKQEMKSIKEILDRLHQLNEDSKSLHKPDALKQIRHRINADVLSVQKKAHKIRSNLEDMDRANAASRRLSGSKEGTPMDRTRSGVTNGLRKKLKEVMMDFQGLRQRMMSEYKDCIGRRYFTVTGEHPDDEVIEKIISNGNGAGGGGGDQEFLQNAIKESVVEIRERHEAGKEIEKGLLELHQVFLDMAVMVEVQGEKLDDIEHYVTNAAQYVGDTTKELSKAKQYQKSSRKWILIMIGIILLILILAIVVTTTAF